MPKRKSSDNSPAMSAAGLVAHLKTIGSTKVRDGMVRFAIPTDKAFGIPVGVLRQEARRLGRNHALAQDLWETGWYEARMLACFLDEPNEVTAGQMDRWCRDFDSWAIVDTACFHLFDKTPLAWRKVDLWAKWTGEFQRRASFALLASLALHDKKADDGLFAQRLPLVERAAGDERNFVKKGVSWALRSMGRRPALKSLVLSLADDLAVAKEPARRWVGKDVQRDLRK